MLINDPHIHTWWYNNLLQSIIFILTLYPHYLTSYYSKQITLSISSFPFLLFIFAVNTINTNCHIIITQKNQHINTCPTHALDARNIPCSEYLNQTHHYFSHSFTSNNDPFSSFLPHRLHTSITWASLWFIHFISTYFPHGHNPHFIILRSGHGCCKLYHFILSALVLHSHMHFTSLYKSRSHYYKFKLSIHYVYN